MLNDFIWEEDINNILELNLSNIRKAYNRIIEIDFNKLDKSKIDIFDNKINRLKNKKLYHEKCINKSRKYDKFIEKHKNSRKYYIGLSESERKSKWEGYILRHTRIIRITEAKIRICYRKKESNTYQDYFYFKQDGHLYFIKDDQSVELFNIIKNLGKVKILASIKKIDINDDQYIDIIDNFSLDGIAYSNSYFD